MTTAGPLRTPHAEIPIAGVPWPLYKVIALAVGILVLLLVAAAVSIGSAVLAGAAAGTVVWLGLGILARER